MKGVVIAGGSGTRLRPLTLVINKHLLPIYDKPMILYPIQTLLLSGINDILLVLGDRADQIMKLLENSKELGNKNLKFILQEKPRGIADAIGYAEEFSGGESICVILGDTCSDANIKEEINNFKEGAYLFLKQVEDPRPWSVPKFDNQGNITEIFEKPEIAPSNYAVTGIFLYDNTVFNKIRALEPSARGEVESGDLNNLYIKEGKLRWGLLNGFWRDTGTFDLIYEATNYWAKKHFTA